MENETLELNDTRPKEVPELSGFSRRKFLKYGGVTAGVALVAVACGKDNPNQTPATPAGPNYDLGSGDIGILNYAYALEQLEAAFYTKVVTSTNSGLSPAEMALFRDIWIHELAHREFFKNALGASAISALTVNFSTINFSNRGDIITTAKTFENLGVSAYNGAGRLIVNPDYLVAAGRIVSIEARHAAYLNDLDMAGSFANTTDMNGLDTALTPPQVLAMAGAYISSPIDASHLPS